MFEYSVSGYPNLWYFNEFVSAVNTLFDVGVIRGENGTVEAPGGPVTN
jgi:hypothetical protein